MPRFAAGLLIGSVCTIAVFSSITWALSFGSPFFIYALLSSLLSAGLLIWMVGSVLMWRSYQLPVFKSAKERMSDVLMAIAWPAAIGALVFVVFLDAGKGVER
jgi:fructose-specific phosphotransferase system IIC component